MKPVNKILALLIAVIMSACGWFDKGPTKQERVEAFNDVGWELFTEGKYALALEEFGDGLKLDPLNIPGNVGRGWSLLMLDDNQRDTVVAALELGAASASTEGWQNHSWCGLAVVKLNLAAIMNQDTLYQQSDSLAGLVLAADSGYVFTYHEQINWCDLLVIQAQTRFITLDYDGAWQALGPLLADTPTLVVGQPNGNLDSADPNTWVVNGITFALYEETLAEAISILAEKYRLE